MDETGTVRPVRDLAGKPVGQVVLGGDSGVTLRDMLATALLLKSKRVPSKLDFLLAPPSRQVLEVLAQSGALVDLVATGARLIEPDHRVVTGEIYPPPPGSISMRTSDPEPRVDGSASVVIASAETLAYAVATGSVGDPRSFKRPVRVTVPRALPTDDVLVRRDKKGELSTAKRAATAVATPWNGPQTLEIIEGIPKLDGVGPGQSASATAGDGSSSDNNGANASPVSKKPGAGSEGWALLLSTLDEVRAIVESPAARKSVRAVMAPFVPSGVVAALASEGIASFELSDAAYQTAKGQKSVALPAPTQWGDTVSASFGKSKVDVAWLATGVERSWTHTGSSLASTAAPSSPGRTTVKR